tara:strand:- start:273 stop:1589 length:1317 start_codon:yes stop_codon:yes gene_type:complete
MAHKLFRDPLYNYVDIDRDQHKWLLKVLDCPEVQRLRRIHQLGVSYFTYPGAEHNRLAHSMGVLYLMRKMLDQIELNADRDFADHISLAKPALLAAALLHDIGHGPFSHLFEQCIGFKHEEWSIKIINDPQTEVHKILYGVSPQLPQSVCDLIDRDNPSIPRWQKSVISSQLDVDRMDYLRRDSLFTGAGYGHFDWSRIIHSVELNDSNGDIDLVWPEKAAMALEEYVFSRYYMYQNVYLHKTTQCFEAILTRMWNRAKALLKDNAEINVVPALKEFWDTPSDSQTVEQYLRLEEHVVLYQMQVWTANKDSILSDLSTRFLNRNGFAMIHPPIPVDPLTGDRTEWETEIKNLLTKNNLDPKYYFLKEKVKSKYRKPYIPEKQKDEQDLSNAILIRCENGEIQELSEMLPRLQAITKMTINDEFRFFVPKELREQAQKI